MERSPNKMGLGALHTVGLAEARKRAAEARLKVHDGFSPIEQRKRPYAVRPARRRASRHIQAVRRPLYRGEPGRLAQCEACRPMVRDGSMRRPTEGSRIYPALTAAHQRCTHNRDRHVARLEGLGAGLAGKAGNR